jgi:hypothetical protein
MRKIKFMRREKSRMFDRRILAVTVISCFVFAGATSGFAQELQKHTWELGVEISHVKYEEPEMEEDGVMYGIIGSYTYHNGFMFRAEGRFGYGQVDYSSPVSGTVDGIDDYTLELRGLAGYDVALSKSCWFTPYIGIGYRYLDDDSSGRISSTGALGYDRESNYVYSPIGVRLIADLQNGWSIGGTAEYDVFWWGKQISYLSGVGPGYNDVSNRQTSGYGLRGSLELQKKFTDTHWAIEPYIRYWHIGESEHSDLTLYGVRIGEAWEPENKSTEYGINLLIRF